MKKKYMLVGMICLLFSSLVSAKKISPTELLKQNQEEMQGLLKQRNAEKNAQKKEVIEVQIKKKLQQFLDIQEIAQSTLKNHWQKKSEEEKKEFTFWLERLFHQTYQNSFRTNQVNEGTAKIDYLKEVFQKKKKEAKVYTLIQFRKKNRKRWKKVNVDWSMKRKNARWMLQDVFTNENSLIGTYQEQFDKIIEKKGWDKLIQLLKKKVNKLRKKRGLAGVDYKKTS